MRDGVTKTSRSGDVLLDLLEGQNQDSDFSTNTQAETCSPIGGGERLPPFSFSLQRFRARVAFPVRQVCTLISIRTIGQTRVSAYLYPPSSNLLMCCHDGHSPIDSVRLDSLVFQRLLVGLAENQLQMLAIALRVAKRQDANRKFEDVKLSDPGAGVAKCSRRSRVHRESRYLPNRVPARGRST